jgi:dihydroxyacid dehydratase/phosphogluconate dehydratase
MLTPTSAIVGYFGKHNSPILLTDGRFSGGSHSSLLIAHLPNSYQHNSITALIQNGDHIYIDLVKKYN